ncbi:uncharacterized protein LOC114333557 [Diabrotica virgifera virgifera]|uniref:Circadian clock-controlled protein-like n=2 Tax=Diabrotica virgifera virgifera TaxID=50390 RepID=A0ABM5IR17_DIAVI|nr:uncharacterized protein LOC114333557 [Diabrotica virgifera virgifera]
MNVIGLCECIYLSRETFIVFTYKFRLSIHTANNMINKSVFTIFLLGVISLAQGFNTEYFDTEFLTSNGKLKLAKLVKYEPEKFDNYGVSGITANMNEYAEKIFFNIGRYALTHGLDPVNIANVTEDFMLASIKFKNGKLHGISTLKRYQDVLANYVHSSRTLIVTLPIEFVDLKFTYDYDVRIFGLGPSGSMDGEIKEFKFYLQFSLDLEHFVLSIKQLKTTDSGHISVQFHGNITDIIVNILSEFITTFLHPLLQGIIEAIIKLIAGGVVSEINKLLQQLVNPNATEFIIEELLVQLNKTLVN